MLPDVPLMVTVAVPRVAEAPAVSVTTLVDVVGLVPKAAVTPVGKPEAESVTLPLKPSSSVTVIVLVPPACVGIIVTLPGEAESAKVGVEVTVREIVVVSVRLPDVPLMVTVVVPAAADALAVSVSTLVDVVGLVPKAAVTPVGKPEAERVTLPVNPFTGVTVMVLVPPAPPAAMDTLVGEAARVKLGV